MSDIHVVAGERHAGKRWKRYTSYIHTATDAVAPLVLPELSRACVAMPVGFIDVQNGLAPVAVQGLEPGKNLLVGDDGHWLADYIPAVYRSYPFALGSSADGRLVLCVVEDSGLLSDTSGEPFFNDHDEPSPALKKVMDFMNQVAIQRSATQHACRVVQKHNLLEPWLFKRQTDTGEHIIEGLHRIDKTALKRLSADAFQEVRLAGALPMIYCHLLSMQHLPKLVRLAQAQAADQTAAPLSPAGDLDLEFLNNGGTVSFGGPAHPYAHGCEVLS